MKLIVTEKNIAAKKLAEILAVGKPKAEKVSNTPTYTFRRDGEEWVSIGLKGHILGVDFPMQMLFDDKGWRAVWDENRTTQADIPGTLATPPWTERRKPFLKEGVDLKTWKLASLPYLVWAPIGKIPAEREIIRALKSLAKKADEVIIATDFDREGELIGSDARKLALEANKKAPIYRARFSAITKDEIERAFAELTAVDDCLAQAGESRQDIDLVWGAVLTRFLTMAKYSGFGNVKSAGRVQTPTLALVVEREKERDAFVPEDYWVVKAGFASGADEFSAGHTTDRFKSAEEAQAVLDAVAGATEGVVATVEKKRRQLSPPTPFNTTALQAAAAAEGISPARTMRLAESLYMDGLVSYPRVDNTVYPASLDLPGILSVLAGVPEYADAARRIGASALHPTRGKQETTDHPPIHPTGAGDPHKLRSDEWKLYNLIARRFLATLSGSATLEATKVTIGVASETFVARGDVVVEPGYLGVYPYGRKKDEQLPVLAEGATVRFLGASSEAKQTQPPSRFSQGSLIQEMEKRGLGTKATRHAIIETLYDRGYIENDPPGPTCLGRAVIDALSQFAPRITTADMTAELEAEMDDIANGRQERADVVHHSRALLAKVMDDLVPRSGEVGEALKDASADDAKVGKCPTSGHDLLIKQSRTGRFVGCTGWPECTVTYPLPDGKIEPLPEPCPECGAPRIKVIKFRSKPVERCLDPKCKTNEEPSIDLGSCPTCEKLGLPDGHIMTMRSARTLKRFARCTNYEQCQTSYPLPQSGEIEPTGEKCEPCGAPTIVVHTRRGPWRICVDPNCPSKEGDKKPAAKRGTSGRTAAKSPKRKKAAASES